MCNVFLRARIRRVNLAVLQLAILTSGCLWLTACNSASTDTPFDPNDVTDTLVDGDSDGTKPGNEALVPAIGRDSQTLLLINNPASDLMLLTADETSTVGFGSDESSETFLLTATESDSGTENVAVSDASGDNLLIASESLEVRIERKPNSEQAIVILLDADEVEVARNDDSDVLLDGSEQRRTKQVNAGSLQSEIGVAIAEFEAGLWARVIDEARALAGSDGTLLAALDDLQSEFLETLGELRSDLIASDTSVDLGDGVFVRPSLFQIPTDDQSFGVGYTADSLLDGNGRRAFLTNVATAGEEIKAVARGESIERTIVPPVLLDNDRYELFSAAGMPSLRFRLNWSAPVDLDLAMEFPLGLRIDLDNPSDSGGELDVRNDTGGPGSVENIFVTDGPDGPYYVQAMYVSGNRPAAFEIVIYEAGAIQGRYRGVISEDEPLSAELEYQLGEPFIQLPICPEAPPGGLCGGVGECVGEPGQQGTCDCPVGFVGDACESCNPGRAGRNCQTCAPGNFCPGSLQKAQFCIRDSWDDDSDPTTPCAPATGCVVGEFFISAASGTSDQVCETCPAGTWDHDEAATPCRAHTVCGDGFEIKVAGTAINDVECADIDECSTPTSPCDERVYQCTNSPGSFSCPLRGLFGADLSGEDLSGLDLQNADLQISNLAGTVFVGTKLGGANLDGASLVNADLTNADLTSVNLTSADLTGATVTNTNFSGATFNATTCPDGVTIAVSATQCGF